MSDTTAEINSGALALSNGDAIKAWQDLSAVLSLGDQARAQNDARKAFAFYARATELDPNNARAWIGRARTAPNLDDAIKSWAYVLLVSPSDGEAKSELAQRTDEKIFQSKADDAGSLLDLGRALAEIGQKELSHRLLVKSTELDDTSEEAWIWRAGVADDSKEIVSCLNHALALNPANSQAQAGLEWAMSLKVDTQAPRDHKAVEEASRLVEQGQQLLRNEDRGGAHELFRQASEMDRSSEAAWLWRGSTTADVDEALTCMEQALAINPQNESAREARSWLRVKKLREGSEASLQDDPVVRSRVARAAPAKQSAAMSLFLIIAPILIILLGLAIVLWKLVL